MPTLKTVEVHWTPSEAVAMVCTSAKTGARKFPIGSHWGNPMMANEPTRPPTQERNAKIMSGTVMTAGAS